MPTGTISRKSTYNTDEMYVWEFLYGDVPTVDKKPAIF